MPTIIISFTFGTILGFIAALRQNTWVDYTVTTVATLGLTVPNFVVATWLILILSTQLGWVPTGGWGEPKNYIMPVIAYSLAPDGAGGPIHAGFDSRSDARRSRPHRSREGALGATGLAARTWPAMR